MNNKSIKVNYIMNIILTMSSFIFPLVVFPYMTRILQPTGIGKVSFASSLISYFGIFAQLGVPTYGIRECAKVRDNKEELSQLVFELLGVNVITCLITYVLFIISIFMILRLQQEKFLYAIMSVSLILNTFGMEWLYRALEEYSYITIRSVIFKCVAIILMFFLVKSESDYIIYGFLTIFASSASNILNIINVKKIIDLKIQRKLQLVKHFRSVIIFAAMTFSTTIYMNLDTVMLGFMTSDAEVGCYDAAIKVKKVLVSIITALGGVLLPRVTFLLENGKKDQFLKINSRAIKYVLTISIPLLIYFIMFAHESIFILCGSSYEKAVRPMQIIMPTLLFIGVSNITGIQVLVPLGKEKMVLVSEIFGAIIDLLINALLIPRYGAAGAAIGTVAAELLVLIVQCVALKEFLKILFSRLELFKVIVAAGVALVPVLLILQINIFGFALICISSVIYFTIYIIILLVQRDEISILFVNELKRIILRFWNVKSIR